MKEFNIMKLKLKSIPFSLALTALAFLTPVNAVSAGELTVGMAMPCKSNDGGFCEAHFRGLEAAKAKFGIDSLVIDNAQTPEDWVSSLTTLAENADLVIGVGAQFDEAGRVVAAQYPDTKFMVVNGSTDAAIPNLFAYGVRQGVPAYIAGVVVANIGGINNFGFIGGLEIPPTIQSDGASRAVAAEYGMNYLSTITGDFEDVPKAKSAAEAQIAEGAQAIYGMMNGGIVGMIQAAEASASRPYLFGSIFPRCDSYDKMVGTAVANADNLVVAMIGDAVNDTYPATPQYYGVENLDIQRFELCPNFSNEKLQKLVDETTAGIVDGSITLPDGV
jgi:basic membrane protein A